MRAFIQRFPVAIFISLTLLAQLSVVLATWWLIPEGEHMHSDSPGARASHMIFRLRIFFPLGLAIAMTLYLDGGTGLRKLFGSFLHWRVAPKWYLMAFTWKFALGYLGIGAVVLLGMDTWPGWLNPTWLSNMITNAVFVFVLAMVEETSWIRFSVTRLQEKYSAFFASTVVGLAWGCWYLMMMLIGEGVPDGIPWFAFITSMFSLSVLLTWAYNTTRSGTVLIIMQVFSNSAFLMVPMLPVPDRPPFFMNAFVIAFLLLSFILLWYAGTEHLNRNGKRVMWSDPV
ncbi:MAG: hypothetical protein IPO90_05555 [Flavobacteriales bacterium]|nr:hypothetical protein [Flavobacteriales bacterium]MBL0043034.1 hypothetical protein [Flavobacteriales bacterium]